ncbi:MAG TPA: GNAT family N-acetyltransferase [Ktedonobacterales bacterium]|nr:GNAT family N-acetyltransferase [Ktedonobacterales bacterium]
MTVYIYPMNMDTDLARVTELLRLASALESDDLESALWQVVAVAQGGAIVGYGVAGRAPDMAADMLWLSVVVDPAEREPGIAAMLYDDLIQFAWEIGATSIELAGRVAVRDRVRVATRRGLRLVRCGAEPALASQDCA